MHKWIALLAVMLFPNILWAADIQATLQWSQRVELSAPVSGVVQSVMVGVGERVKKGQVLLSLDSTPYQAKVTGNQSEITRLTAEMEEAKRDLERIQGLYERTVVSTTDLDQARLRWVNSQSLLAEARSRLRLNRKSLEDSSIRAPFDAIVVQRQAEPGMSVAAGLQPQTLLTLARSGEMIARSYLPSSQMDKLKTGQKVEINIAGARYAGSIKTLGLEPVKIKEEWVYPLDVIFSSSETLRAGASASVKLP